MAMTPTLHTAWIWGLPLCVRCRSCAHRCGQPLETIGAHQGNMKPLKDLRLKCSRCGGRNVETRLVHSEKAVEAFLTARFGELEDLEDLG